MTDLLNDEITLIVRHFTPSQKPDTDSIILRNLGFVSLETAQLTQEQMVYCSKYGFTLMRIILHPDMEYLVKQGTVFEYIDGKLTLIA